MGLPRGTGTDNLRHHVRADHLSARNIGGLVSLVLISGIMAHALWFRGLRRRSASSVTFLSLLNPVVAARLGWVVLGQRRNACRLFGAEIVLVAVVLGQFPRPPALHRPEAQR